MIELLDSDRLAAKFGKWRGAIVGVCATLLVVFAAAIMKLVEIITRARPQLQSPIELMPGAYWFALALVCLSSVLWLWAVVLFYKDQVYEAYREAAHRHNNRFWENKA